MMKKLRLTFAGLLCGLALGLNAQQIINIQASFYSAALAEVKDVRVYLPGNYYAHPANLHYPVIYYFHSWTNTHNEISIMLSYFQAIMANGTIEPTIMVAANNWVEPFKGSYYTNSTIWGNYEDYNVNDVINWVDATFRTIPEKKARAIIGASMGATGAFRLTLRHKDKFCAFAASAAQLNFDLLTDLWQSKLQLENAGPPYSYSYSSGGSFTKGGFLLSAAAAPNLNSPQTYVNPPIVEYMFDENCILIDTVYQKIRLFDVIPLLHQTTVEDSIGILYGCGTNDYYGIYDANAALADTLDALGLPYEFYSHTGGHEMPNAFKERALIFLDSLLMSPIQVNVGIAEVSDYLKGLEIYPNPFTNAASIRFELYHSTHIKITLHDPAGQLISKFSEGLLHAGWHEVSLNAHNLPPGLYFLRFQSGEKSATRKLVKY